LEHVAKIWVTDLLKLVRDVAQRVPDIDEVREVDGRSRDHDVALGGPDRATELVDLLG
jgi:hypothetical protein